MTELVMGVTGTDALTGVQDHQNGLGLDILLCDGHFDIVTGTEIATTTSYASNANA